MFHAETLPIRARPLPTGTILVVDPAACAPSVGTSGAVVECCRVSSSDQKTELRQAGRVVNGCGQRGLSVSKTVTEFGSGLTGSARNYMSCVPIRT